MSLAQGPQLSDAGEAQPAASRSRVKHSTTEPLRSIYCNQCIHTDQIRHVLHKSRKKTSQFENFCHGPSMPGNLQTDIDTFVADDFLQNRRYTFSMYGHK